MKSSFFSPVNAYNYHEWFFHHVTIRSLRNNDGDGNENGKKQNNNFARASRFFVHFFAVVARLRRENA